MDASEQLKEAVLQRTDDIEEDGYHQVILNIMYEHWQDNAGSYKDTLEWYKNEYGELAQFAILIGKYNQQVCNGGHIQYFDNGYADGKSGFAKQHDPDSPLHQTLTVLFSQSGLRDNTSTAVFNILQEFRIALDTKEFLEEDVYDEEGNHYLDRVNNDDYGEVINTHYLSKLDKAYYEICDEFMAILEQYFKEKITGDEK
ncbi:hypothetical protein [Sulfurimonas sp.]|uniref:hypothetical protein n=1 Tax=Sulfurimonas sp. TaxID=2022749 RepID=UPI0025E63453|nr:hypothetical protein [Sulfurimonas sp.]